MLEKGGLRQMPSWMKRGLLAVALLSLAVAGGLLGRQPWSGSRPVDAQETLQFAVDAIAGDGVDSSAVLPVGSTQRVGLHVTSLGGISYQAYQIKLQYDDEKLDLVTPASPPDSWEANNEWPAPDGIYMATGPSVYEKNASGMNTVLVSVTANGSGSSYEGELGFLDFLCAAPGSALLHLIPGAPTNTHLVDDDGVTTHVPAVVVDATISCGEGGQPTVSPGVSPTPAAPTPSPGGPGATPTPLPPGMEAVPLFEGCQFQTWTGVDAISPEQLAALVSPPASLISLWAMQPAPVWKGYSPQFPDVSDMEPVNLLDVVAMCMGGPGTFVRPVL
jgi:hypothetical protein